MSEHWIQAEFGDIDCTARGFTDEQDDCTTVRIYLHCCVIYYGAI